MLAVSCQKIEKTHAENWIGLEIDVRISHFTVTYISISLFETLEKFVSVKYSATIAYSHKKKKSSYQKDIHKLNLTLYNQNWVRQNRSGSIIISNDAAWWRGPRII